MSKKSVPVHKKSVPVNENPVYEKLAKVDVPFNNDMETFDWIVIQSKKETVSSAAFIRLCCRNYKRYCEINNIEPLSGMQIKK